MKKIWGWVVGAIVVVGIGIYLVWNSLSGASNTTATNTAGANPDDSGSNSTTSMNMANATGSMAGMNMSSTASGGTGSTSGTMGQYKDGTYTGSVADAVYGQLQVSVTISGGMITSVTTPVYPNDPGHTSQVSASALPVLEQEAVVSQSANVNVVSGATQDSTAFQQSLAAALSQAKS